MGEFLKVVHFRQAEEQVKQFFPSPRSEKLGLSAALHRVLAVPVLSPEDLPFFHRSTVDGYALDAASSYGSSESMPAYLSLRGEVKMGEASRLALQKGECCWIPTGGMLPAGADAAVMVEYTERLGDDTVLVYRPVAPWENVMQRGEDIRKDQVIMPAGKTLRPQDIGLLASLGITQVQVQSPLRVGILSTGDEIIPAEAEPGPGQVRDVNSFTLAAAVRADGGSPTNYPIIADDFSVLKEAVGQALEENDIILLSGGSSVGIMDVTLDVLLSFPGAGLLFHGVAVKPGKPTLAVSIGDKMALGLPGHPVSALMMYHVICSPALRTTRAGWVHAQLQVNLASQAGRDDFIPVVLKEEEEGIVATPLLGKSGLMRILSMADGYIHIPYEKQGLEAGQYVQVHPF